MAVEEDLVTLTLLGKEMQFRRMSPGQLLLANRMAQRAQREAGTDLTDSAKAYKSLMIKILDIVDTLFLSEEDREEVEGAVLQRKLGLDDLMMIAFGRRPAETPDDDADPAAPKSLRNKKPAGVAKVTKKTANPRRASR